MNKLAFYVLFVFLQPSFFTLGHYSCLQKIEDATGNNLGNLGGLRGDSNAQDQAGVCYGTHGHATQIHGPFQVLPRCHSEFYLLNKIQQNMPALEGHILYIRNESFPPCKLPRGATNQYTEQIERNPGTPCHQYLTNFAQHNHCKIIVRWPAGATTYQ